MNFLNATFCLALHLCLDIFRPFDFAKACAQSTGLLPRIFGPRFSDLVWTSSVNCGVVGGKSCQQLQALIRSPCFHLTTKRSTCKS